MNEAIKNAEAVPERIRRINQTHSRDLTVEDLIWCLEERGALFPHVRAEIAKRLTHIGTVPEDVEQVVAALEAEVPIG